MHLRKSISASSSQAHIEGIFHSPFPRCSGFVGAASFAPESKLLYSDTWSFRLSAGFSQRVREFHPRGWLFGMPLASNLERRRRAFAQFRPNVVVEEPASLVNPDKAKALQGERGIMAKLFKWVLNFLDRDFFRHMWERKMDWFFLVAMAVGFVALEYIANPYERYIPREELGNLQFPFKSNSTVPNWSVPVIGLGIPVVIIIVAFRVPKMFGKIEERELHDLFYAILINVAITATLTSSLKDSIGRPRPNFLHRCYPKTSDEDLYKLIQQDDFTVECSKDASSGTIEEGRKSFPSGHSSWAMCSLSFLTFFMLGKLRPFDGRGEVWRFVVSILPVCGAVGVGITRINDYWHHWTDVVAGFALGLVVSIAVYMMYYPWPLGRTGTERPLYKDVETLMTETGTMSSEASRLPFCNDPMQGGAQNSGPGSMV